MSATVHNPGRGHSIPYRKEHHHANSTDYSQERIGQSPSASPVLSSPAPAVWSGVDGVMSTSRRFQPDDVVVGDWVWGVGVWLGHPVIRVNRHSVTVGIHRDPPGWLTTETVRWEDIRGVIPAKIEQPTDILPALERAARRARRGYLDSAQREALAVLLHIASSYTLPTPLVAVLHHAITTVARPPRDAPVTDSTSG